ncbi:MAG: alpha/beta hydrolase [Maricaulaceae bacterium]
MPLSKNSLHLVDAELRPILDVFQGFDVSRETLPMLRNLPTPPARDKPPFEEVFVKRKNSKDALKLLIIKPKVEVPKQGLPALLYMHGGGFVFGSPETALPTLQRLAEDVGCIIILPAYRLAPEHPFPAALNDNYLALSWMHEQALKLGIDTSRVAIGGDSAGGGHAAVLNIAARDRGEFSPIYQFLIYPMLDDRTGSLRPPAEKTGEFIWTPENNVFGWSSYLGRAAGSSDVPEGSVPARQNDLSGLPPTLIATGSLDLFAPENAAYGKRLAEQGIAVETKVFDGAYHGFNVMLPDATISREFHAFCVKGLKTAFKT